MSIELDKLKERMESKKVIDAENELFFDYSRIYMHSNENLKQYIKNLKDKKVLCVSSSGDHLLNSLLEGANEIDTFDINRYSPLYQQLRIEAVKHLSPEEALKFLSYLNIKLYFKFNDELPKDIKEFFDYLFLHHSEERILDYFFQEARLPLHNNNYESIEGLKSLKEGLEKLKHKHYTCDVYDLPKMIYETYDVIYLSNVLGYQTDYDNYFNFIRLMREHYLRDNGELYFDYLWGRTKFATFDSYFTGKNTIELDKELKDKHKDIINATEVIKVKSVYDQTTHGMCPYKDVVLRIKKER